MERITLIYLSERTSIRVLSSLQVMHLMRRLGHPRLLEALANTASSLALLVSERQIFANKVEKHETRKGCHYYTTELLRRLVYSSERACPSHGRAKDLTDTRCWSSIFKRGCPSIFLQSCHSFTPHQTCSLLEGLFLPDLLGDMMHRRRGVLHDIVERNEKRSHARYRGGALYGP